MQIICKILFSFCKNLLFTVLFFLFSHTSFSQTNQSRNSNNSFFLEIGGRSPLYSINYERIIHIKGKKISPQLAQNLKSETFYTTDSNGYNFRIRVYYMFSINSGFTFFPSQKNEIDGNIPPQYFFPVMFNFLYGKSKHQFILGIGHNFNIGYNGDSIIADRKMYLIANGFIGYRYCIGSKLFIQGGYFPGIEYFTFTNLFWALNAKKNTNGARNFWYFVGEYHSVGVSFGYRF